MELGQAGCISMDVVRQLVGHGGVNDILRHARVRENPIDEDAAGAPLVEYGAITVAGRAAEIYANGVPLGTFVVVGVPQVLKTGFEPAVVAQGRCGHSVLFSSG